MYQLKVFIITVLIFSIFESILSQSDYCSANLCLRGNHIGCNNNGSFASSCPKSARIIAITPELQRTIVKKHNRMRNRIATGELKGFKRAVRMATMRWSPELAKLAEYNVRQCYMAHDDCQNTNKFYYAGQNLAMSEWSSNMVTDVRTELIDHLNSWFKEHKKCSMDAIRNLDNIYEYGHFTAMVNEKNVAVGCAILRQRRKGYISQLMACNYAYSNMLGKPVYRDGKTASKCKTGRNPNFKGLCSFKEKYNLKSTKF